MSHVWYRKNGASCSTATFVLVPYPQGFDVTLFARHKINIAVRDRIAKQLDQLANRILVSIAWELLCDYRPTCSIREGDVV